MNSSQSNDRKIGNLFECVERLSNIGAWEIDIEKQKVYWTKETHRIHETDPHHFFPNLETAIDFFCEWSKPIITRAVDELIEKGVPYDLELQIVTAQKNIKWVRAKSDCDFVDGKPSRVYGIFQDITKQKESEQNILQKNIKLKESLESQKIANQVLEISDSDLSLKEKLDQVLEIIFSLDWKFGTPQGAIYIVSDSDDSKLRMVSQKNMPGCVVRECREVKTGGKFFDRPQVCETIIHPETIQKQREISYHEIEKMGNYNIPLVSQGSILGVISLTLRDVENSEEYEFRVLKTISKTVSELVRKALTNQELEKEKAKVIQTAKMASLGEMASGIAHEINNPLAIIKGQASRLKVKARKDKEVSPEMIEKLTESIESSVDRMAKIVKGLQKLAHGKSSQEEFQEAPISKVINDALIFCQNKVEKKGVELKIEKEDDFFLHCSEIQLSQVLLNLVNNSLDAVVNGSEGEKYIKLKVAKEEENVTLTVEDNGPGIPPQNQDRILDSFFTTKEVGEGTGLGLSISKGIIESHGGYLELASASNPTKFVIYLPQAESKKRAA